MTDLASLVGFVAGALTSLSSLPQVIKTVRSGETSDLSMRTLVVLTSGLTLWVVYGLAKSDIALIIANGIGFLLNATLIFLKVRPAGDHVT